MRRSSLLVQLLSLLLAAAGEARPARIVSMNPCTDAIMVEVADPGQIAGISHWSKDPAGTSISLQVAGRFPAHFGSAEEVIALRPDLVLLSPHTPLATRTALERLGVPILAVGVPASIAESMQQVRGIAHAVGYPERGAALVRRMAVAAQRPAAPPVPALIRMGSGVVPGPGTLADDMLLRSGFSNASTRYGLAAWDMLPTERLVAYAPAVLLTDRPQGQHPAVLRTGVKIAAFPGGLLNCGGPTIVAAMARLADIRATLR